jgi:hypothetical protein
MSSKLSSAHSSYFNRLIQSSPVITGKSSLQTGNDMPSFLLYTAPDEDRKCYREGIEGAMLIRIKEKCTLSINMSVDTYGVIIKQLS